MFNRNDDPTNAPNQEQPRQFRFPVLQTWRVLRSRFDTGELEEIIVSGHGMTTLDNGGVVIQRFYLDPAVGPTPQIVRVLNEGVWDIENITPAEPEDSRIIH